MNIRVPPPRPTIEIVQDLVCPWCRLSVHRLMLTLRRRGGPPMELIWRPFLLNPDMPRGGIARADYITRKFGGEDRARRLHGSIAELGRAEGLVFAFERIRRTPSSLDAHRLVRWAGRFGRATEMTIAVQDAYFADGRDIGDRSTLSAVAAETGLDPREARRMLDSDAEIDAVHAENLRAHRIGINGVPCFVLAGRHAIAGAQEVEVLERMLDVAAVGAEGP